MTKGVALMALMFGLSAVTIAGPVLAVDLGTGLASDAAGQAGYSTTQSTAALIGSLIDIVLGLLGIIFLVLVIYAGITWMTAAGDEGKIATAKSTLAAAIAGLVITLSAYAISDFVIRSAIQAVGGRQTIAPIGGDTGSCFAEVDGVGTSVPCAE